MIFGRVERPYWNNKPIAIVGNGLSLKGFDYNLLRDFWVLAVKAQIFDLPWANAGFGLDTPRYIEWVEDERFCKVTTPVYWAVSRPNGQVAALPKPDCITFLERRSGNTLSSDPMTIHNGASSGFGALNVAWLKLNGRPGTIVLFGYDYSQPKGAGHINEGYYKRPRNQDPNRWTAWSRHYDVVAKQLKQAGVKVINASPNSAITAFPRMMPQQALEEMQECLSMA